MKKKMIAILMSVVLILLLLGGCASVRHVSPDGSYTEYRRVGNQRIGRLAIVDQKTGKAIQLEGQQSLNDAFAGKIAEGVIRGLMRGAK